MKKYLFGLLMLVGLTANAAVPTITITAGNTILQKDQTTLITVKASEPITGFTLSDMVILGNGLFTTGLTAVDSSTYTVTFQKTVDRGATSIVVDNKAYSAVSDGALGVYAQLGINPPIEYYTESGGSFLNVKVRATPQPVRLKVGEILVNSADNSPATKLFERFYIVNKNYFEAVNDKDLFRVQSGQKIIAKLNPKPFESLNPQGAHNHGTLMPKAAYIDVRTSSGYTRPRIRAGNQLDCGKDANGFYTCYGGAGGGEFRMIIEPSHINADDPIVFPNQQGRAHTHTFFANKSVNFQTTNATLLNGSVTTAAGGSINRSAYWAPSIIDTSTGTVLFPSYGNFYYKSSAPIDMTKPIPQGLKGIAGNPAGVDVSTAKDLTRFNCDSTGRSSAPYLTSSVTMPACSGKDYSDLNLFVDFTECLADDGTGKIMQDSPDHRSHWIPYNDPTPSDLPNGCRTAFPYRIANLTQNIHYFIPHGANTKTWRLSSDNYTLGNQAGASLHADYWAMWDTKWMARMTEQCNNTGVNCSQNYIGLNAGIAISSITVSGTTGTVTTVNPHLLDSGRPFTVPNSLNVRISGVLGTDAAAYNFDRTKVENINSLTTPKKLIPIASQPITVTGANTFTYTLNSTPTVTSKTGADLVGAKVQWGEMLCLASESCTNAYSEFYGNLE